MSRALVSYRIAFAVFVLGQAVWIFLFHDRQAIQALLQQVGAFGPIAFLAIPAAAGLGVSWFLWGRSHLGLALAGLLAGGYALVTLQEPLLYALLILGVGWVMARFGKAISLIALGFVAIMLLNGHLPGLDLLLEAVPAPQAGRWTWEVVLALAVAAVPWLADAVAGMVA